jgi:predicted CxxxxCH...CXXCH cytochrome family protein
MSEPMGKLRRDQARSRWIEGALLLATLAACADKTTSSPRVHYAGDVEKIFAKCVPCHAAGGAHPPALDSFFAVADCQDDGTPWAKPGDPKSAIIAVLSRDDHKVILTAAEASALQRFVVESGVAFTAKFDHAPGFATPGARGAFHGDYLRGTKFAELSDMGSTWYCANCHERAAASGVATPCSTCHGASFTIDRCGTCHGDGDSDPMPRRRRCDPMIRQLAVGAHRTHTAAGPCTVCHVVPKALSDPGHIPAEPNGRAAVTFDTTVTSTAAVWDPASRTCSGLRCHGTRTWAMVQATPGPAPMRQCDGCHGDPPASHKVHIFGCDVCHAPSYDSMGQLNRHHMNGTVDLETDCAKCHGGAPSPGFGADRGAHATHLLDNEFRLAYDCSACHLVPTRLDSPGHIDHDLPAIVTFSGSVPATAHGQSMPIWDSSARSCSDVGCHGAKLDGAMTAASPWVSASAGFHCGGCHDNPPSRLRSGGTHPSVASNESCSCHTTPMGQPIDTITGATTRSITAAGRTYHIDGCVEVGGPAQTGCPD